MAAAFHHGTETIRIDGGSSPVYTVNGAITAIIGTAPTGAVNELTVCQTKKRFRPIWHKHRQGLYFARCREYLDTLRLGRGVCCERVRPE